MVSYCMFELLFLPYFNGAILTSTDDISMKEIERSDWVEMRAKISFMCPVIIFEDNDGIIRGNIGLIEDECLFLWAGPFMLGFFK